MKITSELIAELRAHKRSAPQDDGRLIGFVVDNDRFGLTAGLFLLNDLLDAAERGTDWSPIETLGFGVDQHIIIATEYGFAWVVECDKDMDGEWLKRSYGKDAEHTGPVTHWRLLDLPTPRAQPNDIAKEVGNE